MRIFSIVGLLLTVVIVGIMAAVFFKSATAPITTIPEIQTSTGTVGGATNPASVIDTARGIASKDQDRQREMQSIIGNLEGAGGTP